MVNRKGIKILETKKEIKQRKKKKEQNSSVMHEAMVKALQKAVAKKGGLRVKFKSQY